MVGMVGVIWVTGELIGVGEVVGEYVVWGDLGVDV